MHAKLVPRLENQEADVLTNMEFKSFDHKKRLDVDLEKLEFGVLLHLFDVGDAYVSKLAELKAKSKATVERGEKRRKLAGDSLRERDPW